MKIVTNGSFKEEDVFLDEAIITYIQEPDCTEDSESDYQKLTLSTRNNGTDKFLNLKTENWSFDNIKGLVTVVEDFKKRIGYEDSSST